MVAQIDEERCNNNRVQSVWRNDVASKICSQAHRDILHASVVQQRTDRNPSKNNIM